MPKLRDDDTADDGKLIKVFGPYGPYPDRRGGQYYKIVTEVQDNAGQVKRRSARRSSETEINELKEALEAKLRSPQPIQDATVADLKAAWRRDMEDRKPLTPNRLQSITGAAARLFALLPDDTVSLRKAVTKITRAYQDYLRVGRAAPRTMKTMRALLIDLGRIAKATSLLPYNPWENLPRIERKNGTPARVRLTVREAQALWRCCRGLVISRSRFPYWTRALHVALLLGTGARLGDVQDAQVRGLDYGDCLRLFGGKSKNAARVLGLGSCPWLIDGLRELAAGRPPEAYIFTQDPLPEVSRAMDDVDPRATATSVAKQLNISRKKVSRLRTAPPKRDQPVTVSIVRGSVNRLCMRARITVVSPHGLRRTNTDLRAIVGDPTLRALVAEKDRAALGHRAGSATMEQVYMAPELKAMRDAFDGEGVLRFLESSTAEPTMPEPALLPEPEPALLPEPEPAPAPPELADLLKRVGKSALLELLARIPG